MSLALVSWSHVSFNGLASWSIWVCGGSVAPVPAIRSRIIGRPRWPPTLMRPLAVGKRHSFERADLRSASGTEEVVSNAELSPSSVKDRTVGWRARSRLRRRRSAPASSATLWRGSESDLQHTLEIKDEEDGTFHPLPITRPVVWSYPTLDSLCDGLSRQLFLADGRKYQVHRWEKDDSVSVVTLRKGYMPAPVFLRHPVAEVETSLDIILRSAGRAGCWRSQARHRWYEH